MIGFCKILFNRASKQKVKGVISKALWQIAEVFERGTYVELEILLLLAGEAVVACGC